MTTINEGALPTTQTTIGYSGNIETFTVGTSGYYDITADGAQGGANNLEGKPGGLGAMASGEIYLAAGAQLEIVVGGQGQSATYGGGGGGGGSFVIELNTNPAINNGQDINEVIAGGGGGGDFAGAGGGGLTQPTGGAGGKASDGGGGGGGAGGVNGAAGQGGYTYGGGGGFAIGASFTGGVGQYGGGSGGFGGGGFGANTGGGGGGGFGGGGGGALSGGGGGGGSYVNASATDVSKTAATNSGDGSVTITEIPCYRRGTRIATARGEIAVEALRVGDLAFTASGAAKPIHWVGHRDIYCRRHPNPRAVWPVRVSAGAFGDAQPSRDLWLSPGHCVAVEGVLIPIRYLLNGRSIALVETDRVEYWHVELNEHDIILAEGLTAESYLDTGNRGAFANGGAFIEAHPDFEPKDWRETCLPLVKQGPEVARTKARVLARLFEQGHELTREADAHVVADGRRVEPIWLSEKRLAFALPAGSESVVLKSNTFIPAHALAESGDERELGLCVARLQIDGGDVALEDEALAAFGWHGPEGEAGRFQRRWTHRKAALPAGARLVVVDLAGQGYYWREPINDVVSHYGDRTVKALI
jgi:hypothetical protein